MNIGKCLNWGGSWGGFGAFIGENGCHSHVFNLVCSSCDVRIKGLGGRICSNSPWTYLSFYKLRSMFTNFYNLIQIDNATCYLFISFLIFFNLHLCIMIFIFNVLIVPKKEMTTCQILANLRTIHANYLYYKLVYCLILERICCL